MNRHYSLDRRENGGCSKGAFSLRGKLGAVFAAVIGAISVSIYIYFPSELEDQALGAVQAEAQGLADMSAFTVRTSVVFGFLDEASIALEGALAAQDVVGAIVVDQAGRVLASHQVEGGVADGPTSPLPDPGISPDRRAYTAIAPIVHEGETIGRVLLTLSLDRVRGEVQLMRGTVGLVSLLVFALGMLAIVFAASWVIGPLLGIVRVAEGIADGELSRRAEVKSTDEVGALARSFNLMVDRLTSAQERLESAKTELEQALDYLPGRVGVFDLNRRILYLNPSALPDPNRRGWAIGRTFEELRRTKETGDGFTEAFIRLFDRAVTRNEVISEEISVTMEDGEEKHFIALFSPIRGSNGSPAKVIAFGLDITDRRKTEEALADSEERYRQAQKMEAVGRLAGGVAHDFNNLLTAIYGHADMAQAGLNRDHGSHADLDQVKVATERATRLTKQLLAFSRQQVLQPTVLDLNEVVQEIEKMICRLIGEHIQVTTRLTPESVRLRADRGQLDQVILNLAVNAGDAMPDGGFLEIETARVDLDARGCGELDCHLEAGPHAVLTVTDTGAGMDEETRSRIFEPFFTTKGMGKGTGLGLATVFGIVEQSEGCIRVESAEDIGTTFSIFLPLTEEEVSMVKEESVRATPANEGETILVVEDESQVRTLLVQILRQGGYRVLPAQDPNEALEIAQSHRGAIDLLLTDVVMPHMSGTTLARKMEAWRPGVKVALMSGYPDKGGPAEGHLDPDLPLLQKPFKRDKLHAFVREVLGSPLQEAG